MILRDTSFVVRLLGNTSDNYSKKKKVCTDSKVASTLDVGSLTSLGKRMIGYGNYLNVTFLDS